MKYMLISALFSISLLGNAGNFEKKRNGEFITMSGVVRNVTADSFNLRTFDKNILVEMDDYDWDADGYKLVNGDNVVVTGRIDHDFFERKKIEASSVYVKGIDSYFFASSDDEEGPNHYYTSYSGVKHLPETATATISGIVVAKVGRDIKVDTGVRKVTVDTSDMTYNPLDDEGITRVGIGDFVRVSGQVDETFLGKKELEADYIIEI
jgi:uncharacterized protein YdeI (BOF family)